MATQLKKEERFNPELAFKEHLLSGQPLSMLEAVVLYGISNGYAATGRLRKDGFNIQTERIPLARAYARLKKLVNIEPPADLPTVEITITEWRLIK